MKNGDLLIADLFSECRPMFGIPSIWKRDKGYEQYDWLFCLLENFGANVGLHGRMDQLINRFLCDKGSFAKYGTYKRYWIHNGRFGKQSRDV